MLASMMEQATPTATGHRKRLRDGDIYDRVTNTVQIGYSVPTSSQLHSDPMTSKNSTKFSASGDTRGMLLAGLGALAGLGILLAMLVGLASGTASAQATVTRFKPKVIILVPADVAVGTVFEVSYVPVEGSDLGCLAVENHRYRIRSRGNSYSTYQFPELVDRPAGVSARCSYDITWPEKEGLVLRSGYTMTVSATSVSVAYYRVTAIARYDNMFSPEINISVPLIDDNGDGVNDFSQTNLEVSYAAASGQNSLCTSSSSETYIVGDDGDVELSGMAAVLMNSLAGGSRCSYDIIWPDIDGLVLRSGATTTLNGTHLNPDSRSLVAAAYDETFSPNVSISVILADDVDEDTVLSQASFLVSYVAAFGSNENCTASASETYVQAADDAVEDVELSGSSAKLVDRPAGVAERCSYDVVWPEVANLTIGFAPTATVVGSSKTVLASYLKGFSPDVSIVVPDYVDTHMNNLFGGVVFAVSFTAEADSHRNCTETESENYVVQSNGDVELSGDAATLVDRPGVIAERCSYDVEWPVVDELILDSGATLSMNSATPVNSDTGSQVSASYLDGFYPDLTILVPQIDDNDGNNVFAGVRFTVTYARVSDSSTSCTLRRSERYVVNDDGDVELSGTQAGLIDRPVEATASVRCSYYIRITINRHRALIQGDENFVVSDSSKSASFSFSSIFAPRVKILVPGDVALGTEIDVSYVSVAGSDDGCVGVENHTYRTSGGGNSDRLYRFPDLVGYPTGSTVRCLYNIVWPELEGLELRSGATMTVSAASPLDAATRTTVLARYDSMFTPDVAISVTQVDDADGDNVFSGTSFEVRYVKVSGADESCTASASETYVVNDDGDVELSGAAVSLMNYPAGVSQQCSYVIGWPVVDGLELESSASATVSATNQTTTASYLSGFKPVVAITVTQVDDADGDNVFSGTSFEVNYVKISGSDARCTAPASETYVVNDDGDVELSGAAALLIDRPVGAAVSVRCSYGGNFPLKTETDLFIGGTSTFVASVTSKDASISYFSGFTPKVNITVTDTNVNGNNVFSDASFEVNFTRANSSATGCTESASVTYVVNDRGAVELSGAAALLVDRTEGAGVDVRCSYDVVWPVADGLALRPGATATVNALTPEDLDAEAQVLATYFGGFHPNAAISVTQVVDDDDGENIFSGAVFTVSYTRVLGSNVGCTASATESYVVNTEGDAVLSGPMAGLVNHVATVQCSYGGSVSHGAPGLFVDGASTFVVSESNKDALVSYISGFEPTVAIVVPNDDADDVDNVFSGTSFEVSFTRASGSNAGCTESASATYVVDDEGAVGLSGAAAVLVNFPEGATDDEPCSYDLIWPIVEGLALRPGATTTVTAPTSEDPTTGGSASASYDDGFHSNLAISLTQVDDADGDNVFAGVVFTVSYTRVSGSNAGCTLSAFESYEVNDDGDVVLSSRVAGLIDRPADAAENVKCSYVGSVSHGGVGLFADGASTFVVSDDSRDASVSYISGFKPDVAIDVSEFDDNDGDNVFSGTRFIVSYARADISATGCTESASDVHVVDDEGVVELSGVAALLVDRAEGAGVDVRCSYDVIWPVVEGLALSSGATTIVTALTPVDSVSGGSVSASYFDGFHPNVTITVPQVDDASGDNVFMGEVFTASYAKVSGSNAGCTVSASESYEVNNSGETVLSGPAASLVDRPEGAGEDVKCFYDGSVSVIGSSDLQVDGASTFVVSDDSKNSSVSYLSVFSLEVTISVPMDLPLETELMVSYIRADGSNAGCVSVENHTYRVKVAGNAGKVFRWPKLVDRPSGVTTDVRCSYRIIWHDVEGLVLSSGAGETVSATDNSASAVYIRGFHPDLTISVPQFDEDSDGTNDFAETVFSVSYVPVVGSDPSCTASASESYEVGSNGTVTVQEIGGVASRASLVNSPVNGGVVCSYNVMFSETNERLDLLSSSTVMISADDNEKTVHYKSVFSPIVAIRIPDVDNNGDDVNDFSGNVLIVRYDRGSGSSASCSLSASESYEVGNDGTVALRTGTSKASLVGIIGGESAGCSYDIMWPDVAALHRQTAASTSVGERTKNISIRYYTVFRPNVTITVPDSDGDDGNSIFSNVEFVVNYARTSDSDGGCISSGSDTFAVGTDGTVARKSGEPVASLANRIGGVEAICSYEVQFPSLVGDLALQVSSMGEVVKSSVGVEASYATVFSPNVTINLPRGAGGFSGQIFDVRYDPLNPSMVGCSGYDAMNSVSDNAREEYVIGSDGSVSLSRNQGGQTNPAKLVDRVVGSSSRCSYEAKFEPIIAEGIFGYSFANSSSVVAVDQSVVVRYLRMSYFYPNITLKIADIDGDSDDVHDFSGTKIKVTFKNASLLNQIESDDNLYCSDDFVEILTIQDSGNGDIVSSNVDLIVGQPRSSNTCTYDVSYEVEYGMDITDKLARQSGSTSSVNSSSHDVSAVFSAGFVPSVSISVPQYNGDTGNINNFSGTEFTVIFKHSNGLGSNCSDTTIAAYSIDDNGEASATDEIALVEYTWEMNSQGKYTGDNVCAYTAMFDTVVGSLHLQTSGPFNLASDSRNVSVSYSTVFEPKVIFGFPLLADDSEDDVYEGLRVRASVRSQSSDCSTSTSLWFNVQDNGEVERIGNAVNLVDWAGGSNSRCSYRVTVSESLRNRRLLTNTSSPGDISSEADTIVVVYKNVFSPELSFSITGAGNGIQADLTDDEVNVDFRASDSSHDECTDHAFLAYIVGPGNIFIAEGDVPNLVDNIPVHSEAGVQLANQQCTYTVSFDFPDGRLAHQGTVTISGESPVKVILLSVVSS